MGGGGGGVGGWGGGGCVFFFFNDTATTEIYTLSLHDALPICVDHGARTLERPRNIFGIGRIACAQAEPIAWGHLVCAAGKGAHGMAAGQCFVHSAGARSEEHTSELQSPVPISYAVFCLKKKKKTPPPPPPHPHTPPTSILYIT